MVPQMYTAKIDNYIKTGRFCIVLTNLFSGQDEGIAAPS